MSCNKRQIVTLTTRIDVSVYLVTKHTRRRREPLNSAALVNISPHKTCNMTVLDSAVRSFKLSRMSICGRSLELCTAINIYQKALDNSRKLRQIIKAGVIMSPHGDLHMNVKNDEI